MQGVSLHRRAPKQRRPRGVSVETSRYEQAMGVKGTKQQAHNLVTQGIHQRSTDNRQQTQTEFARNLEAKTI